MKIKQFFTIKKKESWGKFATKAIVFTVVFGGSVGYFASRYKLGFDEQHIKCIPGITWYLVDTKDKVVKKDATYVFLAKNMNPIYPDGTKMVKYVRALPGDEVEITAKDYRVLINGEELFKGVPLSLDLKRPPESFVVKGKLAPSNYWMFGTNPFGFDSRYWGSVHDEQIVGRAYPLF